VLVVGCDAFGGSRITFSVHDERASLHVEPLGEARIRIQRGGERLELDLAREISGCSGPLFDQSVNETYEGGASFEKLDEAQAGPYTYLVLFASAPSNCNVQGQCGAATDSTLVWLKLNEDLKVAGKQAFALEDCRKGRSAKGDYPDGEQLQGKNLPWKDGVLWMEYEEESGNQAGVRRLIYDRNHPDAGFQISPNGSGE